MTDSNTPPTSPTDRSSLHDEANRLTGRLIYVFAKLETDIVHCFRSLLDAHGADAPTFTRSTKKLKQKLAAMRRMVAFRFTDPSDCLHEFQGWRQSVNRIRVRRNAIAHGRWRLDDALLEPLSSPDPTKPATDRPCPVDTLREDVERVGELCEELAAWRERWVV